MKVHYKIALVAAVVLFTVVGGYFLTQGGNDDATLADMTSEIQTSVSKTAPRLTGDDIKPVPLTPTANKNAQAKKDLNSLVRAQLAAINKQSAAPIISKPIKPVPPVIRTPAKPTTLTFNGSPIENVQKPKPMPTQLANSKPIASNTPTPPVIRTAATKRASVAPRASSYPTRYTIQPGDTLSSIALTLYGSDRHWGEIAQANPTIDPLKLKPDQTIKLPLPTDLRKPSNQRLIKSPNGKNSQYTVRAGDNLSTIAQEFYKNSALWRRIYNANKSKIGANPDTLQAGVTLDIPPVTSGSNH